MRTKINKKSDFDFIVLDSEGNPIPFPTDDFSLFVWTWGSKCRFKASSIKGVLTGCKNEDNKLRVFVDNPGFVPGKLVGELVTYITNDTYDDGSQRTCRYISDFGIDMVDGDSITNEQQVLAMMQYIQGASAYEIACEYGYQGTEEEWLNSLSLESVNAANECRELMAQLSAAEDVRNANEQTRIANEQARVESESSRSFEESNRVDAESTRMHNESVRHNREEIRQDAENYRITHENSRESNETMRQNSETARITAEESRVAAEESRQAAEQARATAEASRITAESSRDRTHDRLKAAMREYADAESLREESEAERREAEQYRIEYEQSRQSAEADRATNERNRVAAEQQRVSNETARKSAESSRVTAETARQTAETARQEAEQGRVTAEQARADAEAARAEEFATFEGKIAAKEDKANKVTTLGADATDEQYPSAKAVKDAIQATQEKLSELENKQGIFNVDANVPLSSGQFYTASTARSAVPASVRKLGMIITYKTDATTSVTEQFLGLSTSEWSTDVNWKIVGSDGGNKILEWETDAATTRKQVKQSDRKSLLLISYKNGDGDTINEQYIGTNYTDTEWEKDSNWEQIVIKKELDKTNTTIGDFFNSVAAAYGSDITKVLEYLSLSVEVILEKVNASIFTEVEWIDTIFGIGDNTTYAYNAWAPACAKYDDTLGKVVFIQCHKDNHSNTKVYPSQVWAINPYDLLDEELLSSIECANDDVPLSFDIYDGVYYLVGEKSTWKSTDHGKSFSKTTHNTLDATYGMQIIDGVMYIGNDNTHEGEIIYYTSSDFGETFQEHRLAGTYDGVKWSEVNFLKFKNNLYMCSRREDLNGLLFRQDGESWTLISDKMPNVSSDCHMYAADNAIAFGAIDRPNKKLILGTIEIGADVKIDVKKEYDLKDYTSSGDFHTPSYVYNKDFQMVTFMIGVGTQYQQCNNAAIVGYRNINTNKNVDYTWRDTGNLISNIIDEPYVGTKFDGSNVIKGNVYNLKNRMLQTYPLEENGDIIDFYQNPGLNRNNTASWLFQTSDFINSKHGYVGCLIRDPGTINLVSPKYKMIFKAKKLVVANIHDIGEIVPPSGKFNYVRYCQDAREGNSIPYVYRVAEIVE